MGTPEEPSAKPPEAEESAEPQRIGSAACIAAVVVVVFLVVVVYRPLRLPPSRSVPESKAAPRPRPSPTLNEAQALQIARDAAVSRGIPIERYNRVKIEYSEGFWYVTYEMSPMPPGGIFWVSIEDATSRATLRLGH